MEWTEEIVAYSDLTMRAEMEVLHEVLGVEVDEDVLRYIYEVLMDAFSAGGWPRVGVSGGTGEGEVPVRLLLRFS